MGKKSKDALRDTVKEQQAKKLKKRKRKKHR